MRTNTMPQALSDDALTALVVELYEAYYTPLFAYVYQLVGDAEWAHDLIQEIFLRLYRERVKLEAVENRRAWVYRIASNVAFSALRRRRRRLRLPWQKVEYLAPVSPDPTASRSEQQMDVEQALQALPAHYRAPLLLFSSYGLPLCGGHGYADTTGQVRIDWIEDITVEVVDGLPPAAEALWQEAAETDLSTLPPAPTPPAVSWKRPFSVSKAGWS